MAIQLDHLILAVNDRKKSVEFYVGILGLKYEGDSFPFPGGDWCSLPELESEMSSSTFRDFFSPGAGVTPAEGSVKPTAGFT